MEEYEIGTQEAQMPVCERCSKQSTCYVGNGNGYLCTECQQKLANDEAWSYIDGWEETGEEEGDE